MPHCRKKLDIFAAVRYFRFITASWWILKKNGARYAPLTRRRKNMKIKNILNKRIAELMALKQVYHQKLTTVNSYKNQSILISLNSVITYVNQQKDRIRAYQKQIEQETISLCTEINNTMQFTMMLLFSRPAVSGYNRQCDMGALCI